MGTHPPKPRYDSDLQMFCETPGVPHWAKLRFYRWLAEAGRLEHAVFGPPTGTWAEELEAVSSR